METIPFYVQLFFCLTVLLALFIFFKATHYSKPTMAIIGAWLLIQSLVSLNGFYTVTDTLPPRFVLVLLPPLLLIVFLFAGKKGRGYIDCLDAGMLTLFHFIRLPVEIVLFWLFLHKGVPELMTFEGRNFDVLSGLSAPFIYYFGFVKKKLSNRFLLAWNFSCLALLLNIIVNAILAVPTPFQQFGFDQPNLAVLHFPFVLLPAVLVPAVLFAHLVSIRQLLKRDTGT
ncbi:MAG: hypothetical protein K0S33_371 [Bacteroidetes bacterium]|jgi:hypothetical protein|nr:hypothetical protein [Bacteroidota bacterium]